MIFGWSDFREFENDLSSKKMPRDAAPAGNRVIDGMQAS